VAGPRRTRRPLCHALAPRRAGLGKGAGEVFGMCSRAFPGAAARVAFPHPSSPLFEPLCAIHEVRPAPHALTQSWELPDTFAADDAPLKFLVNPNSPTGTWADRATVRALVDRSPGVVV